MDGSITARCCRLVLGSAAALALTVAPYRIGLHGSVPGIEAASAQAAKGGNGGGNGGNGNGGSNGNGGNSGGGNNSGGNGNSGNSGNGSGGNSSGGNSGASGGDDGGGDSGSGKSQSDKSASHVDKVEVDGNKITVQHPDGMTEKIENGRFRMLDALGRTIIDRRATPADVSRLKAL